MIKGPFGKKVVEPGYFLEPWESLENTEGNISDQDRLNMMARHFGMDIADFIEWAARRLGIPPCPVCQSSKQVLYRINEIGWLHGAALLWRIRWKQNLTANDLHSMGL